MPASPCFRPVICLASAFLGLSAALCAQSIETPHLRVSLGADGALAVADKRAGVTWRQTPSGARISGVTAGTDTLTFTLNGHLAVRLVAGESTIDLTLSGPSDTSIEGLEYPTGFTLGAAAGQRLLLPTCTGFSIPFAERRRPDLARAIGFYEAGTDQGGLMMPWIATTDGQAGCLMLLQSPFDARMKVGVDDSGYTYTAAWKNTRGRLGYSRQVRYYFRARGGAVALCKSYRDYARAEGFLVTLRDKQKQVPALGRFPGALSFWVTDWPDASLPEAMKAAGIDRALLSYHVTAKVPPNAVNRPGHNTTYEAVTRPFADRLHTLGYLAGRYDYYRTIFPPSDAGRGGNGWIMRFTGYPEQLSHDEHGRVRAGFQGRNATPGAEPRGQRCSKCQFEMARVYIPVDVDRVGYDARLLDAVCAVGLQECYNPAHPTTREEDMRWRLRQLSVALENGQITGTEHMGFWAVPLACYAEAPTTFVRFAGYRESFNAALFAPPPSYRSAVLDERLRFPLWQLVFHDAVVLTNRWTFTANRYTDESIWDQEDLINLLHGNMPTFMTDRENFAAKAARLARTAQTVGRWNAETGFDEMTDFRWLADDGSVQEAVYESGRSVVVNFGEKPFALASSRIVPARGHSFQRPR